MYLFHSIGVMEKLLLNQSILYYHLNHDCKRLQEYHFYFICFGNISIVNLLFIILLFSVFIVVLLLFPVDLKCFLCVFMCHLVVAIDGGRYLVPSAALIPGHVANWLLLIALIQVDFVGLKHAACKNLTNSFFVLIMYALLHCICIILLL